MMAETSASKQADQERAPEEIERDIEETREDLADTVAAVADKTNVKKQAKAKVEGTKQEARAKAEDAATRAGAFAREHRVPLAVGGAVLGAIAVVRRVRR